MDQGFPRRRVPTLKIWAPTYYLAKLFLKTARKRKKLNREGRGRLWWPFGSAKAKGIATIIIFSFSIHDPAFKRWMPHVNLTYPFIPDDLDGGQAFKNAAERAQKALASVQPFQVVLTKDSFQTFSHKKFQTMWLR